MSQQIMGYLKLLPFPKNLMTRCPRWRSLQKVQIYQNP